MITLHHPDGSTEKLRWTDQVPGSHYGLGVVFIGKSNDSLSGEMFRLIAESGGWVECGDSREMRRVAGALAWGALGLSDEKLRLKK
jgi:hypothetical protein